MAQCASVHNAATYLAEAEDWDFLAVYYDMIDHAGHDFARYEAPRMEHISEEDFKTYRYVIESTYRYHDMMLGRWLELIDDQTTVIVLSDHGFYHGEGRPLAERARLSGERPAGVHTNPLVWHRLHGVFVASGPGIKKDSLVHSASLLDVAPTILTYSARPCLKISKANRLRRFSKRKLSCEHVPVLSRRIPTMEFIAVRPRKKKIRGRLNKPLHNWRSSVISTHPRVTMRRKSRWQSNLATVTSRRFTIRPDVSRTRWSGWRNSQSKMRIRAIPLARRCA